MPRPDPRSKCDTSLKRERRRRHSFARTSGLCSNLSRDCSSGAAGNLELGDGFLFACAGATRPPSGLAEYTGWDMNVLGQSANAQKTNPPVRHVYFPPAQSVPGRTRESMVVIVPAFAKGQDRDPPQVG